MDIPLLIQLLSPAGHTIQPSRTPALAHAALLDTARPLLSPAGHTIAQLCWTQALAQPCWTQALAHPCWTYTICSCSPAGHILQPCWTYHCSALLDICHCSALLDIPFSPPGHRPLLMQRCWTQLGPCSALLDIPLLSPAGHS